MNAVFSSISFNNVVVFLNMLYDTLFFELLQKAPSVYKRYMVLHGGTHPSYAAVHVGRLDGFII